MSEERPEPTYPKPWFYRPEYFVPAFFFPPVWSILVLRSPWNRNIIVGGVAWAVLFIGGFLALKWVQNGSVQNVIALFLPGTLLTIITQVQWEKFRSGHAVQAEAQADSDQRNSGDASLPHGPSRPPRPTARRRSAKRRGQRN